MTRLVRIAALIAAITFSSTEGAAQQVTQTGHPTTDQHPNGWSASCYSNEECDRLFRLHMARCHHTVPPDLAWCTGVGSTSAAQGRLSRTALVWLVPAPTLAALFAGIEVASQANQPVPDNFSEEVSEENSAAITDAAMQGALAGLGLSLLMEIGIRLGEMSESRVAPGHSPWWRRARIATGVDRRGATRVGLTW